MIRDPYNSLTLQSGSWLSPDNEVNSALEDYELGGIALNDPSQGLRVQKWTLNYDTATGNMNITDEAVNTTLLFNRANIKNVSLAFDQNMNPFVGFVEDNNGTDEAWFWWFDTDLPGTVFTQLPAGTTQPVACLDDKRETQTFSSDIIIAYVRGTTLYFRAQRDRYTVEYTYLTGLAANTVCKRVGMNDKNRLQFLMNVRYA